MNKFEQKEKILQKNENAHEIRKKRPGFCPGVILDVFVLQVSSRNEIWYPYLILYNICESMDSCEHVV